MCIDEILLGLANVSCNYQFGITLEFICNSWSDPEGILFSLPPNCPQVSWVWPSSAALQVVPSNWYNDFVSVFIYNVCYLCEIQVNLYLCVFVRDFILFVIGLIRYCVLKDPCTAHSCASTIISVYINQERHI